MKQHCLSGIREPGRRAVLSDVMRSPAQPLSREVRAPMERRFHHDFSAVRIHSGNEASRSAAMMSAAAFTVGHHVVFGENRYQPDTNGGSELLAHELDHVTHPPPSRGDAMQILRSPLPQDTTTVKKPDAKKPDEKKKTPVETLTDKIAALLKPMTAFDFKQQWALIDKQLKTPGTTAPKAAKSRQALYEKALVDELKAVTAAERVTIATSVHDQLVKTLTSAAAADVTEEYKSITKKMGAIFENDEAGYVYARKPLMDIFGTSEAAVEYYKSFLPANFPSDKFKTPVHPNLQKKLASAKTLLEKKKWLDGVVNSVSSVGGIRVRENRSNHAELSDHSFGWAVDIDPQSNPYFGVDKKTKKPQFPGELVEGLTGTDVYKGSEAKKINAGGTADELLIEADALKEASDTFRDKFDSETSLQEAFVTYLGEHDLDLAKEQAPQLFAKVKTQKQKDVATWLSLTKLGPPKEAPAASTEAAPVKPAAKGAKAPKAAKPKPAKAPEWEKSKAIATFLISAYGVYKQTRTKNPKTKKEEKIAEGANATPAAGAAAHGFVNLSGELIAALTASDGGGLVWLGANAAGVKDFHHFELKHSDRPVIKKAVAKKADETDKPKAK
jgi:hypothetical protein